MNIIHYALFCSAIIILGACGQNINSLESTKLSYSYTTNCSTVFGWSSYGMTDKDVVFIPKGKSMATDWYASWGMTQSSCTLAMQKCKNEHRDYSEGCKIQYTKMVSSLQTGGDDAPRGTIANCPARHGCPSGQFRNTAGYCATFASYPAYAHCG